MCAPPNHIGAFVFLGRNYVTDPQKGEVSIFLRIQCSKCNQVWERFKCKLTWPEVQRHSKKKGG